MKVFTTRSTGIGVATGVIVAVGLGQLLGVVWGLAALNGLAAGTLALALAVIVCDGRFDMMDTRRRPGVRVLAFAVMMGPMLLVDVAIGIEFQKLRPESFAAVKLLFGLAGFAAYALGGIMAALNQIDEENRRSHRPRRLIPLDGE
jgi:hypothetical protein